MKTKNTLKVLVILLLPLVSVADENLDKAVGLCKAEVQYFSLATGKVDKVVFPNDLYLNEMPNAYFIEYRDDLKAGAYMKSGKKKALDVRCHIQKRSLNAFYVKINNKEIDTMNDLYRKIEYVNRELDALGSTVVEEQRKTTSTSSSEQTTSSPDNDQFRPIANIAYIKENIYYIPTGMLSSYIEELGKKDFYLTKKNGTIADNLNDIEKLCRDYAFLKSKILEYSQKGEKNSAADARNDLEVTNRWLDEYHEDDVQTMFSYLNLLGEETGT